MPLCCHVLLKHWRAVPALQTSLVFISQRIMRGLRFKTTEDGAKRTAMWWRTVNKYRQHWQARGLRDRSGNGTGGSGVGVACRIVKWRVGGAHRCDCGFDPVHSLSGSSSCQAARHFPFVPAQPH